MQLHNWRLRDPKNLGIGFAEIIGGVLPAPLEVLHTWWPVRPPLEVVVRSKIFGWHLSLFLVDDNVLLAKL
jgi:hypothetical protein